VLGNEIDALHVFSTGSGKESTMDVSSAQRGDVTVVTISGSIDATTAPALAAAFTQEIAGGRIRLVADFAAVAYTSSAGLRALLGALKESRQHGGDFRLAGVRPAVFRVLEMSGFTSILKHFPDVDGAVASFAA
jgi:anti-sigma B factor antagonist